MKSAIARGCGLSKVHPCVKTNVSGAKPRGQRPRGRWVGLGTRRSPWCSDQVVRDQAALAERPVPPDDYCPAHHHRAPRPDRVDLAVDDEALVEELVHVMW